MIPYMAKTKTTKPKRNQNRRKPMKVYFKDAEKADIDSRRGTLARATFVRVQALRKDS